MSDEYELRETQINGVIDDFKLLYGTSLFIVSLCKYDNSVYYEDLFYYYCIGWVRFANKSTVGC